MRRLPLRHARSPTTAESHRSRPLPLAFIHSLLDGNEFSSFALTAGAVKVRAAYDDSFAFWKDADPDIPILKQAKAEYAKLQ